MLISHRLSLPKPINNGLAHLPRMVSAVMLCALSITLLVSMPQSVWAEDDGMTLQGHVDYTQENGSAQGAYKGRVIDSVTGNPVEGASVDVPDKGYRTFTDKKGRFGLPEDAIEPGKQAILSVEKAGYSPFSVTVSKESFPNFPLKLIKEVQVLVLDNKIHHLGDGSFSAQSAGAGGFRRRSEGPTLRLNFTLSGQMLSDFPKLVVGSIVGLDTKMAHTLSRNPISAHASPLMVRFNGQTIAQIAVNGDAQVIQVPPRLIRLNGSNTVEITAGFHYPEPGRLDYDDMELMHVVFHP